MRCEEYKPNVIAHALGELPPTEAAACNEHIQGCAQCRKAYDAYAGLTEAAKGTLEQGPTASELESMSRALDGLVTAREQLGSEPRPSWWSFGAGRAMKVCFAACAVIAVALAGWKLSSPQPAREHQTPQVRTSAVASAPRAIKISSPQKAKAKAITVARKPEPEHRAPAVQPRLFKQSIPTVRRHRVYVAVKPPVKVLPEPQHPQSSSIPPEAAYRAGQMLSQGLSILADNTRPEKLEQIRITVKGIVLPLAPKDKGESNEKNNPSDSGDRLNGSAAPAGTMCIQASAGGITGPGA